MSQRSIRLQAQGAGEARLALPMADRLAQYDVRLRREITHRRLAVSMFRRLLRVLSLHVLDAAILASVVVWLSKLLPGAADVRPLTPA
ncbi:MAG TPA: hypothetical protein VF263_01870, partial [Longimicrobiaceae bacterium]